MQDALDNDHALTSRKAQELTAYWHKLAKAAGGIPPRSAFDPIAIPSALPSVFLIERLDADTYRFRLLGTDFAERGVSDLTGALIKRSEVNADRTPIFSVLDRVLNAPCGLHILGVEQSEKGRQSLVEYVALPLTDEEGAYRFVVGSGSPLATLGYDDEATGYGPLIEVRDLREIPLSISEQGAA
ncbi:MAG: hypothetical protein CMI60_13045 [Parvibaculum sp.]|jgi:hypothetical protein|nr:hypothetical protein [Parvibaculum sp.]|tara:strand:+ start:4386 stop:4940 length:555 start_codon:yes stop_codon:yes gene_type:complete